MLLQDKHWFSIRLNIFPSPISRRARIKLWKTASSPTTTTAVHCLVSPSRKCIEEPIRGTKTGSSVRLECTSQKPCGHQILQGGAHDSSPSPQHLANRHHSSAIYGRPCCGNPKASATRLLIHGTLAQMDLFVRKLVSGETASPAKPVSRDRCDCRRLPSVSARDGGVPWR